MGGFARCKCFLNSNVYVKNIGHLVFKNEAQFIADYGDAGPAPITNFNSVLHEAQVEVERRKNLPKEAFLRTKFIQTNYTPLHPEIYHLKEEYLHPNFLSLNKLLRGNSTSDIHQHLSHHENEVYSFPLYTQDFCSQLLSELDHFNKSNMPKGRPNSMNNYGVLLEELGFNETFLTPLRSQYFEPLCKILYPFESEGEFDSHKAFTVDYSDDKDVELDFHFDNAEVTMNVCLSADCDGGELYFGSPNSDRGFGYLHRPGWAVVHRGSAMHCVLPLTSGRRVNLVMWMRSSLVRNRLCPMCKRPPDLDPVENGWGDGFLY